MTDFFEWLAEQERSNPELYQSWVNAQLAEEQDQYPESLYNAWLSYKSQPIPKKSSDTYYNSGIDPNTGKRADKQKQEEFERQQILTKEADMERAAKEAFEEQQRAETELGPAPEANADVETETVPQPAKDNTLDLGAIPPTVQTTQPSNTYYNSGIDPYAGQRADKQKQEEFERQQAAKKAFEEQQKAESELGPAPAPGADANVEPETVPQPEAVPTKTSRRVQPEAVPTKASSRVYPVTIPAAKVDSRVYSLDNINKLNPKAAEKAAKQIERNQKIRDKEAAKAEKAAQKEQAKADRIYKKEAKRQAAEIKKETAKAVPAPETIPTAEEIAAQKEQAKAERDEQKKAAKANRKWTIPVGDAADAINNGINAVGNAIAAEKTEGQVGLDPSGQSAMLRQQADDQMKQAAEMNMFKQQQLQDANVSPEQRAEQYAAASAAAKHAQQGAQSKPGEYVDTVVENPDIAQQQQMQQQYRQQAQELSKDANQYLNAARQRTMDAQKVDYDYNENRRVNDRIYQLTGGMGIKGNDGKYQIIGGSRDSNNAAVSQPEATPTTTPTSAQPSPETTTVPTQQPSEPAPTTAPTIAPSSPETTPAPAQKSSGVNNVNFVDESIKQREAAKQQAVQKTATSTPTPSPTINPNGTTSTNASTASQQYAANTSGEGVPTYIIGLWKWYNAARQIPDGNLAKLDVKFGMKKSAEIQSKLDEARRICSANTKPGLQQFNLGDYSYDNCMKVYRYVEPYVRVNKGDK